MQQKGYQVTASETGKTHLFYISSFITLYTDTQLGKECSGISEYFMESKVTIQAVVTHIFFPNKKQAFTCDNSWK